MKGWLGLLLFISSCSVQADFTFGETTPRSFFYADVSFDDQRLSSDQRSIISLSVESYEHFESYTRYFRVGYSALGHSRNGENTLYLQFEGFAGIEADSNLSPFIGIGFALGEFDNCPEDNPPEQDCILEYAGIVPEIGVNVTLFENWRLGVFYRKYYFSDVVPDYGYSGFRVGYGY